MHDSFAMSAAMTATTAPSPDTASTIDFEELFDKNTATSKATCNSSTSTNTNDLQMADTFGTNFDHTVNAVPFNFYGHDTTIESSFSSDSICRHNNAEAPNSTNFLETFNNHTSIGGTATVTNLNTGTAAINITAVAHQLHNC